ncbi:MAG: PAS domain S-box protein, partial [Pseudomonadota bacterium]
MSQDTETRDGLTPGSLRFNQPDAPDGFFRAVVENAADMISVINQDGVFTYACPKAADAFGFEHGSIDQLTEEHFHPDDYDAMLADFTDLVVNGGRRQLADHRMSNGRGGWIWIQTHAINLVDDPRVKGIVMVSRDITVHKQREEQLRNAEKSVGFGHWRWDDGALGPYWSDGLFSILGLKREDCDPDMQWASDRIADEDREAIAQISMQALVNGESFSRIVSMRHEDGKFRRLMVTGHVERDQFGKPTALVGVSQDVTDLEQANKAIRNSEQEFRLLAEHSTDVISRYDVEGNPVYVSPSVERVLGYPPEVSLTQSWDDFTHPQDRKHVASEIVGMFKDHQTRRVAYRMMASSGEYLWLESAITPLVGDNGEYQGMVTCTRDITEQKTREQELMAAREHAE